MIRQGAATETPGMAIDALLTKLFTPCFVLCIRCGWCSNSLSFVCLLHLCPCEYNVNCLQHPCFLCALPLGKVMVLPFCIVMPAASQFSDAMSDLRSQIGLPQQPPASSPATAELLQRLSTLGRQLLQGDDSPSHTSGEQRGRLVQQGHAGMIIHVLWFDLVACILCYFEG